MVAKKLSTRQTSHYRLYALRLVCSVSECYVHHSATIHKNTVHWLFFLLLISTHCLEIINKLLFGGKSSKICAGIYVTHRKSKMEPKTLFYGSIDINDVYQSQTLNPNFLQSETIEHSIDFLIMSIEWADYVGWRESRLCACLTLNHRGKINMQSVAVHWPSCLINN